LLSERLHFDSSGTVTLRLGLVGPPGAGKSTVSDLIRQRCAVEARRFHLLKLAEPLYEAQEAIYRIAGVELPSKYSQDGELLNFLGHHLRKLRPSVLLDNFNRRLQIIDEEVREERTKALVLCDDVRWSDAEFLRSLEFRIIRIQAPPQLCLSRRVARADLTLGSASHSTETNLDQIRCDDVIDNSGSLDALAAAIERFLGGAYE